jgi:ribonuclease III
VSAHRGGSAPAESLDGSLGVRFSDLDLREAALIHRSYAFEQNLGITNERLEFLGDAVLGIVVTDLAYRRFPDLPEGSLAKVARELDLGSVILLGKGEEMSGGRDKPSILADALEAVLGAVYLDLGLGVAGELIERLFWPRIEAYARGEGDRDYKTILQELASQDLRALPEYQLQDEGPDHEKEFTATVYLAGEPWGTGRGRSKKEAEQRAAREAFEKLSASVGREGGVGGAS